MGGAYASNIMAGPFFSVNVDSGSTEIEVPEVYKTQPAEVSPIVIDSVTPTASITSKITLTEKAPIADIGAVGYQVKLGEGEAFYKVNDVGRGNYALTFTLPAKDTISTADTHLMFYFETDGPMSIALQVKPSWATLKTGQTVYLLQDGKKEWEEVKCVGGDTTNCHSRIEFGSAFSGYVKIAYSGLSDAVRGKTNTIINMYFAGMGDTGEDHPQAEEMTVGPFLSVSSDSPISEYEVNSTDGDVNVDGVIDAKDLGVVRKYLLSGGTVGKYLEKYGDVAEADSISEVIDILDLVKIASLAA